MGHADGGPNLIEVDSVVALQVGPQLVGVFAPYAGKPDQFFAARALQAASTFVKNSLMSDTLVRPFLSARPSFTFL